MAMDGLTEVLIPTERKVEYCRMIGALNLSNLAFGQRYHCEKDRRQCDLLPYSEVQNLHRG